MQDKPATKKFLFFSTAGARANSQKLYNEDLLGQDPTGILLNER